MPSTSHCPKSAGHIYPLDQLVVLRPHRATMQGGPPPRSLPERLLGPLAALAAVVALSTAVLSWLAHCLPDLPPTAAATIKYALREWTAAPKPPATDCVSWAFWRATAQVPGIGGGATAHRRDAGRL